jgi:hypothetical protein
MSWGGVRAGWSLVLSGGGGEVDLQASTSQDLVTSMPKLGMIAPGSFLSLSFQRGKEVRQVVQVLVVH